jgi:hypothetical protein
MNAISTPIVIAATVATRSTILARCKVSSESAGASLPVRRPATERPSAGAKSAALAPAKNDAATQPGGSSDTMHP